jgi:iron complex outermembrane recepter protein
MSKGIRTYGKVAWSMALSTAVIGAPVAFAAPAAPDSVIEAPPALEEVVVTAEKRESTVQETPISITAITGADIQAQGLTSLEDAVQQVPGLFMTTSGPGQTEYVIRGISNSTAGTEVGKQATTGFYLDDTPIAPPSFASAGLSVIDPDLFDLNRIEVLRGPQGTLYGDGSEGGTIKLVTNEPNLTAFSGEVEGTGSATQGGGLNGGANIMLNVPIVADEIAMRVVGTEKHVSGWIDRVVVPNFPLETGPSTNSFLGTVRGDLSNPVGAQVHHDVNDTDLQSVRVSVLFKPIDQLTIEPGFFYQKLTQGGFSAYDSNPGTLAHYQPFDVSEPFETTFKIYTLTVNYDFPSFSLTSATGYQDRTSSTTEDASEQAQNGLFLPAFDVAQGGVGPINIIENNPTKQFSQELRLTSTTDGPLQWILGGFYSDDRNSFQDASISPTYVPIIGSDNLFVTGLSSHRKEVAAFGNANYALTHKLTATAGLRYSHAQTTSGIIQSGYASVTGSDQVLSIVESQKSHALTPRFNLSYSQTDDLMLYATAAKGFRQGAGEIPVPTTGLASACLTDLQRLGYSQSPTSYGDETVWSYEAGEKAQLFDRRVTLNSDVFYANLSNTQVGIPLPCGYYLTVNAAEARSFGTDIELAAHLGSHVVFSQSVNYTKAQFTKDVPNSPDISKGQPLPNVPGWSLSTSIEYTTPVSHGTRFSAMLRNSYIDKHVDFTGGRNELPGYDLLNVRAGLATDTWSAYLFVDNLTNKQAELTTRNDLFVNNPAMRRIITNQPRTIGIDLGYSF